MRKSLVVVLVIALVVEIGVVCPKDVFAVSKSIGGNFKPF